MFSCLQILEAFLWFVLITLLNVTLIILTLSVSRLLNLLLRLVAFLLGIITTIMATIQRINIIGSREGSRNRRRLKANQTGKKFRVGIKSNISTNRNNLIS